MDTSLFDNVSDKLAEAKSKIMEASTHENLVDAMLTMHEAIAELASITRDKVAEAAAK